jgi:hypothetical protein
MIFREALSSIFRLKDGASLVLAVQPVPDRRHELHGKQHPRSGHRCPR